MITFQSHKRIIAPFSLLIIMVFCAGTPLFAQVWQWSTLFKNERPNAEEARAFLWIPENCKKVRGVVVAQNNMEELSILEHVNFRKQLAKLGFAEIWVNPPFDHVFNFNEGAYETFNNIINSLANISGYTELKFAPVVPIGHSAAASWPYYFAVLKPERTLCAISVSGQWPYFRDKNFAPDIWDEKTLDYVPCLETMGEYETAATWSAEGLKERSQQKYLPLSMLACPAEGHFAATEKKIDYIALYIKKAAQYRLSNKVNAGGYSDLNLINPNVLGWLMEKWIPNKVPTIAAAPVTKYKGDRNEAFWFFDEEMAKATELYEAEYSNKKAELLAYIQDGQAVKQRNTHLQVELKFMPDSNGISFRLKGGFLDTVPGQSPRPTVWTGIAVDSAIGHAFGNVPVSIDKVIGPFKKINNSIFQISFDKTINSKANNYTLTFAATHPGDAIYKPAVQQAEMKIPSSNNEGLEQSISFEPISNQPLKAREMELKATSSLNLPVYFYVLDGPAEVSGNKLIFTAIPPQSKFPISITVIAWQYGSNVQPKIKTAKSIAQTFYIDR